MLFALLALFVGSLLVAAAFTSANGDIKLTRQATAQSKAYFAAVAGINRYQFQLTSSPEYWTKCPAIGSEANPVKVTGTTDESYAVKTVGSTGHTCESGKQATILETTGTAKGTFRILSTGTATDGASTVTRKIVATFTHPGFTKYVYESNYEVEDPVNFGVTPATCEHYYPYRLANGLTGTCKPIQFAPTDEVNGPMHTNDGAATCTSGGNAPKFGREGRNDEIAIGSGGWYEVCSGEPNIVGRYTTTAASVLPPKTDAELLEAAGTHYDGRTEIELIPGTPNKMKVTNKGATNVESFPSNGVVYVENSKTTACAVENYTPFGSDTINDTGCGNVYVHGEYTESLTIASADDVIVNGNLKTTTASSGEPTGAATLGLIAENFVRVYHPVKKRYETANVVPATKNAINGKCVTETTLNAKVLRSTEVSEITTTGLSNGDEVEGVTAGLLEPGTTIAELKAGEKLKLNKAAKPAKTLSAKLVNNSTEVKEINTTGLVVGAEVEGSVAGQIEAGTTISEVKAAENKIKLSKPASTKVAKELSGSKIVRSTEVAVTSFAGLAIGQEVEGPAGQIAEGTTITELKEGEKKIKLSAAAKPALQSISGEITNNSTEVKKITTAGLVVGGEVEGSGIAEKTTITEIKESEKKIKLSKVATSTKTTTLKFYGETLTLKFYPHEEATTLKIYGEKTQLKVFHAIAGYAYNAAIGNCHKVENGWDEYITSENRYITTCEGGSTYYESEGYCEIVNTSSTCSSRATNLNSGEDPNGWGVLNEPVIDAAILSTNHSWIVDNYKCGAKLEKLTVWGSIAQFWRGPVGTSGGSGTGYIKNYNYDDRLANQQPPSFLSPTNATSWKISRETGAPLSFTG